MNESEYRIKRIIRVFELKEIFALEKFLHLLPNDLKGVTPKELREAWQRKQDENQHLEDLNPYIGYIIYPSYDGGWNPTSLMVAVKKDGEYGYQSSMNGVKRYWSKSDIEAEYIKFKSDEEVEAEMEEYDDDDQINWMDYCGDEDLWSTPFEE